MWDSFIHLGQFNRDSDPLPRYVFKQAEVKVLDDATCRFFGMGISMGTIFAIDIAESSSVQFPPWILNFGPYGQLRATQGSKEKFFNYAKGHPRQEEHKMLHYYLVFDINLLILQCTKPLLFISKYFFFLNWNHPIFSKSWGGIKMHFTASLI